MMMSLFHRRLVVQVDTCSGVCVGWWSSLILVVMSLLCRRLVLLVQVDICSDVIVPSSVGGPS